MKAALYSRVSTQVLETYLRELRDIHAYYERVKAQCYSCKDKLADTL